MNPNSQKAEAYTNVRETFEMLRKRLSGEFHISSETAMHIVNECEQMVLAALSGPADGEEKLAIGYAFGVDAAAKIAESRCDDGPWADDHSATTRAGDERARQIWRAIRALKNAAPQVAVSAALVESSTGGSAGQPARASSEAGAERIFREALEEIAKGEGAFSRDPLQHATNTIENMKNLATLALSYATNCSGGSDGK